MHSSSSFKPLLAEFLLPMASIVADTQLFPSTGAIKPDNGFVFGEHVINSDGTQGVCLFKPSDELQEVWAQKMKLDMAGPIESLVFSPYGDSQDVYKCQASYMKGVGSKLIGFTTKIEIDNLVNSIKAQQAT